jgi:hypothetical protein
MAGGRKGQLWAIVEMGKQAHGQRMAQGRKGIKKGPGVETSGPVYLLTH